MRNLPRFSSPPAPYNFAHIPLVTSGHPLWSEQEELPVLRGLHVDERELVLTTVLDAKADVREHSMGADHLAPGHCDRGGGNVSRHDLQSVGACGRLDPDWHCRYRMVLAQEQREDK